MGIILRSSQGRPRESTNRKWLKSTDQGKVWCHHKVFIDFSLILEKSLLCAAPPPAPWASTCPRPILWLWTRVHLPPGSLVNRYCLGTWSFFINFWWFLPPRILLAMALFEICLLSLGAREGAVVKLYASTSGGRRRRPLPRWSPSFTRTAPFAWKRALWGFFPWPAQMVNLLL